MRVLFLNYEFPKLDGESGETCYYLLREYSKNPEIEIDFVTTSEDDQYHLLKMGDRITIHGLPIKQSYGESYDQIKKNLKSFAKISLDFSIELAKQKDYDLIHAFSVFPCAIVARKLGKKLKLPYVVTLRKGDVFVYSKKGGIADKITAFYVAKALEESLFLVANTQLLKDSMLNLEPKKEISIIRSGIDVAEYFPDTSKRSAGEMRIICVSTLSPMRGVRSLIQAFKILSGRYDQVRLTIVGDGNERKSLEDLVQGLELKGKIEFVGAISGEDVIEHYQRASIFVRPSLEDTKNRIVLEAMASGLPVITTDTEGISEIIFDKQNGFIVKKKDPDDLAEKIENFILNEAMLIEISKNSRLSAEQVAWSVIAKKYFDLYVETRNLGRITL